MIPLPCKAGDLVEVRSADEILATLDETGCRDGLPFMPEMLQYCGRQFHVAASAHKTCDSTYYADGREMQDTVVLAELRCNGSGHGNCEAECLLLFKLDWLRPIKPAKPWKLRGSLRTTAPAGRNIDWLKATAVKSLEEGQPVYRCQGTDHLNASKPFQANEFRMFVADVRSRNVSLGAALRAWLLQHVFRMRVITGGYRLYELLHWFFYGRRNPFIVGKAPANQPTPDVRIGLEAGETVRVRGIEEIEPTLNHQLRNRGLSFNPEMSPFCHREFKVKKKVRHIIDERSGRMLDLKNPCIMLEGVYCEARYHPYAVLCPRRIPQYFREAWLERVGPDAKQVEGSRQ